MPFKVSENSRFTMSKKNFVILFVLISVFACKIAAEDKNLRQCKTNVTGDQCPPNTSCSQQNKDAKDQDGLCLCLTGFVFNKNFTTNETYCVVNATAAPPPCTPEAKSAENATISTSTSTTTTTTLAPTTTKSTSVAPTPAKTSAKPTSTTSTTTSTTTTTTKAPEKVNVTTSTNSPLPVPTNDGVQKEKIIESEHMFGGFMLPLVIVAAFIGGVFLIRKHNLLERAHNYISERNWRLPGSARPNYTNDFDEFDDPLLI
ncbi:integumentary mucin C.1-like [Culicoides brevitarsis]|uniref:integumentary mucin C.1-like n=1 Tax=Culicoides brevitarsis TaxID=469753 RepID=UPI00307BCCF8